MKDLFSYFDYKAYLNDRLDAPGAGGGRGARARLSRAMGCQTAYTAQVLRGTANLSLEQAEAANEFLNHTEDEGQYFLTLVQLERAGTPALKKRLQKQLQQMQEARLLLRNRFGVKRQLPEMQQMTYYSSWHYSAIHALVSVAGYREVDSISKRLGISSAQAARTLEFLQLAGLIQFNAKSNRYDVGATQIHLGLDSPMISKHHANWRLRAMHSLEQDFIQDVHYSSVVSLSEKDLPKIREILTEAIRSCKEIIRNTDPEEVYSLCLDWFRV